MDFIRFLRSEAERCARILTAMVVEEGQMHVVPWVEEIKAGGALATPLIAAIVAFIAAQQWRTSRQKLALELFEKRLEIYESAIDAASSVVRHGGANKDDIRLAKLAYQKSVFLFGPEVAKLLSDLLSNLLWFEQGSKSRGLDEDIDRGEKHVADCENIMWRMQCVFAPYMRFTQKP